MGKNIFMEAITPEKPKVLAEERLFVYVRPASETHRGIASFDSRDFVAPLGDVTLRWPMKDLVEQADPIIKPSITKVLSDEFENTNTVVTLVNSVTGESYQSAKAEIKLNRKNRNALARPDLVMLSDDFEAQVVGQYNSYRIKRQNPLTTPTIVQVDQNDFGRQNEIVQVRWPFAHNPATGSSRANGYGLVKVDITNEGALQFSDGKLQVNKQLLTTEISDLIIPLITKETIGLDNLENKNFTTRLYSEFSQSMKDTFDSKFAAKLDKSYWDGVTGAFRDWSPELDKNSVQKWFEALEGEDDSIKDSIRSLKLFVGIHSTSTDLQAAHPASEDLDGSYAYVVATDTYWAIRYNVDTWEWYDTTLVGLSFLDLVETDSGVIQPNGVGSVGSSGKWAHSDHIHPADANKANLDTVVQIVSEDPDTDDFLIKLASPTVNVPHVKVAQYLHNWRGNTSEFIYGPKAAYWSGSAAEFDDLASGDLPNGSIIVVDEEEQIAGQPATIEALDETGVTLQEDEQIVVIDKSATVYGRPVTINVEPATESRGERRRIEALDFGNDLSSPDSLHRAAIIIDGPNGRTIGQRIFVPNRLLKSDNIGNIQASDVNPNNIIVTTVGDEPINLQTNEVVVATGNKTVQTWASGMVINKPIVSDGNNGIKALALSSNKIIKTDSGGGLESVIWREDNLLKTDNGVNLVELDSGKVVISGVNNNVQTWNSGGAENALIVRGASAGSIKLRTPSASNRLLITKSDGSLEELPAGTNGQMLVSGGASAPGWLDVPSAYAHLPQTRLTENPDELDAIAFQGLVAVVLSTPIDPSQMRNNCIYYF